MAEEKTVHKHYHYNETDDFASYLEQMAKEGWEFEEWTSGLLFRKAKPADVHYAVDIFPRAKNMDERPEQDTLEFSEYCRAAGWRLVDSKGKFCIFRRIRDDAVPIVSDEERFSNVTKAEAFQRIFMFAFMAVYLVLFLWIMFDVGFPDRTLSKYWHGIVLVWIVLSVMEKVKLISFIRWRIMAGRQFSSGEKVYYGNHNRPHWSEGDLAGILIGVFLIALAISDGAVYLAVMLAVVLAIVLIMRIYLGHGRPSRRNKISIMILITIIVIAIPFMIHLMMK